MSIKSLLHQASVAYYNGNPFITNEEYDALESIHGQIIGGSGDVEHAYRMYSLNKHYDKDGELPLDKKQCTETVKLDGAAISILYADGTLAHALTRGNGIMGKDITEKVKLLGIPTEIPLPGIVQVTGEVVASKNVENSRNYASGALNLKDIDEWIQRIKDGNMRFIAYNIQVRAGVWGIGFSYYEDLCELNSFGFHTIVDKCGFNESWEQDYPTDGTVYRLDDNEAFNSLGFTDKFPRGAIAWKEEQESVETTLLDVIWQTGKSGKCTPVALLEPVLIGEATISRATLNNIAYIEALELEIGCRVKLIRSGEIIPKIIGRV